MFNTARANVSANDTNMWADGNYKSIRMDIFRDSMTMMSATLGGTVFKVSRG